MRSYYLIKYTHHIPVGDSVYPYTSTTRTALQYTREEAEALAVSVVAAMSASVSYPISYTLRKSRKQ